MNNKLLTCVALAVLFLGVSRVEAAAENATESTNPFYKFGEVVTGDTCGIKKLLDEVWGAILEFSEALPEFSLENDLLQAIDKNIEVNKFCCDKKPARPTPRNWAGSVVLFVFNNLDNWFSIVEKDSIYERGDRGIVRMLESALIDSEAQIMRNYRFLIEKFPSDKVRGKSNKVVLYAHLALEAVDSFWIRGLQRNCGKNDINSRNKYSIKFILEKLSLQ